MRIDGRVFIVTGASSGIGLATARILAARGGHIALVARSTQALDDLAGTLPGSVAVTADMTDVDGIRRAVADIDHHFGRVDGPSTNYADGDTPEFVAELIVKAIEDGGAQYFANDRLRQLAGA